MIADVPESALRDAKKTGRRPVIASASYPSESVMPFPKRWDSSTQRPEDSGCVHGRHERYSVFGPGWTRVPGRKGKE